MPWEKEEKNTQRKYARFACGFDDCECFRNVCIDYSNILRAEEQSGKAMMGQLLGNLFNIILDPIMILGFKWDIPGAAIATVIGNVLGTCYYIQFFFRGKSILSIHLKYFTFKEKVASGVLGIGIPAALGSLMMSISQIVMNSNTDFLNYSSGLQHNLRQGRKHSILVSRRS